MATERAGDRAERTFVLVHGGWEGGWYWRPVADRLRERGFRVFTPTLTGLGERTHLLSPTVDLSTHIDDVLGVIRCEELSDVVLVGHSYGGMVVTGVADRCHERIAGLVYLDAFVPRDGQSIMDLATAERQAQLRQLAEQKGDGWRIPPIPAAAWGITDAGEAAWIDRHSGDHPFATMTQPIELHGNHDTIARRLYVLATGYDPSPFQPIAARLRDDPEWDVKTVDCHHFLNVSRANEVADILAGAAG